MVDDKVLEFPDLEFDDATHTYRLNGVVLPSVTTIMKPLSMMHYGGIDEATLERAAHRGTMVHNAIENYVKFGVEDIPAEHEPYFKAFLAWMNECEVKPISSETRLYHKQLKYAGTADMGCEERGVRTLVDFKTTSSFSGMLCGVQLEAYERAFESHGVSYVRKIIIQLMPDGTYKRHDRFPPRLECWKVFSSLMNVSAFHQKYK